MKGLKVIYSIIAVMPFIWFVTFLAQLLIGFLHFKTIPREYIQSDPCSIGLCTLNLISSFLLLISLIVSGVWIIMSIALLAFNKKSLTNRLTLLFVIGVSGFLIFRFGFPEVFGWVLD